MAKRKDTGYLAAIAVLLVVIGGVSYFSYQLYTETVQQAHSIETLQGKFDSSMKTISNLTVEMSTLESSVADKQSTIDQLGQRLGLAQSEIESMKPVVKQYYSLAVKSDGTGTVTPIQVKMTKGTGLVSVNIKNVELMGATQGSVRTAVFIAGALAMTDTSNKDFDISFVYSGSDFVTIDGPSAGAAITTLITAALENKTIDNSTLVTGTIEKDGSVGPVGGVDIKAVAARDFGATTFLVPVNESVNVRGMSVREVSSIEQVTSAVLKN